MQTMLLAAELAGAITGIAACICLLVKPLRNRIVATLDLRFFEQIKTVIRATLEHRVAQYFET